MRKEFRRKRALGEGGVQEEGEESRSRRSPREESRRRKAVHKEGVQEREGSWRKRILEGVVQEEEEEVQ